MNILIGIIFVRALKLKGDKKVIFLYHSTVNNFVFLVLPFVEKYLPGKGPGLLFIHNIGYILLMWTLGIIILSGYTGWKTALKNIFTPGFIATLIGIAIVFKTGKIL